MNRFTKSAYSYCNYWLGAGEQVNASRSTPSKAMLAVVWTCPLLHGEAKLLQRGALLSNVESSRRSHPARRRPRDKSPYTQ